MMYNRIRPSFINTIQRYNIQSFDHEALALWVVDMSFSGIKPTTIKRYLGGLHTLYRCWSKEADNSSDPFDDVQKAYSAIDIADLGAANHNLSLISRITNIQPESTDYLWANIFLYLLYDVKAKLQEAIDLRFDNFDSGSSHLMEIVDRMKEGRNAKYVFPLGHGDRRMSLITSEVIKGMHAMLKKHDFRLDGTFSRESISGLWIAAARQCGINAIEIRSMLKKVPEEYAFLNLITPKKLSREDENKILEKVANTICNRTLRWFVMKLRNGKTPEDVKKLMHASMPKLLEKTTFYYPTRHQVKRIRNKNIHEDVPYLPDILFFRTYHDTISAIMRCAGEAGWCFKVSNTPDSPYATISINEMKKFQRHVGAFTPDIEMELVATEPDANIDDNVRIVGGDLFEGQEGTITKVTKADGKTIYTIRLTQSLYIKWTEIDIDGVFIEPV